MTNNIAFTTIHGSRLYGLNHENSDYDNMFVYMDDRKAVHYKAGDIDNIHVGIFDLVNKAIGGSHQYIEGVFSQQKKWEDETYRPFIENLVIPGAAVREKFERTIKKLSFEDLKLRRHAVRLSLGLAQLTDTGKMNPTLTDSQVFYVNTMAETFEGEKLFLILTHQAL